MRILYSISVYALLSVLFVYFLWRSLEEPGYRQRWRQRLGHVPPMPTGSIWIHAASVGEVQAATPMIEAMLAREPGTRLLVTTFTPTGSELVRRRIDQAWGERVSHCYLPLDTPTAVRRFLETARPRCCLIVETELWPNLLLGCRQFSIPVHVVSATLSERSLQRYLAFPASKIILPALGSINRVFAQSTADADRFSRLGLPASRITIIGNIKFDYRPPASIRQQAMQLRERWHAVERPLWVAASTHEGEEQIVLEAFRSLKEEIHDLLLVIVPRHPQRFERAYRLCLDAGLCVARHARQDQVDDETEVILGDTVGQLILFYAASDVVFVGGSLVPVGGHNLLEPAALGHAVISGGHTGSQAQLRNLLDEAGAFIEVNGAAQLARAVRSLLESPSRREELGAAAEAVIKANQGIVGRLLDELFHPEQ